MTLTNPQNIRVDAFQANVRHLAQQEKSKLYMHVDSDSQEAETNAWDRLSSGDMGAKSRNTASATNETGRQWSRRQAVATPFIDHELVETQDINMMLVDPKSKLLQSMGMAAGREYDDIIIAAATGTTNVITRAAGVPTTTATAFAAGQIIGDYSLDISFDYVAQVQRLFMQNDIDPTVPKVAVVGPQQVYQLLNLTEQTSGDYVNKQALQTLNASGVVHNWMGFTWIMSTRLTEPTTAQKSCLFFTERALGLHRPQDVTAYCERDPSRQYAWRPQTEFTAGACRIEDEQIVWLKVKDSTVA
jgi:hypothetical protein